MHHHARIDPHAAAIPATEPDDADGVLGLCRAVAAPPGGLALAVAVHPQSQGRGIGRALYARFLAEVQQRFPDIPMAWMRPRPAR